MNGSKLTIGLAILAMNCPLAPAQALQPVAEERAEARRWIAAKFDGIEQAKPVEAELKALAGPVSKNQASFGRPLNIGGTLYRSGLQSHAPSKLQVVLPSPGETFTAVVGVDGNSDFRTQTGGSVVFIVQVEGREVFRSEILRAGMLAVPVSVALSGARELVLEINDAGDGNTHDEANWADATVALQDGRTIRLGGAQVGGYSAEPPFSFKYGNDGTYVDEGQGNFQISYQAKPSAELLKTWKLTRSAKKLDEQRTEKTLLYADPQTGLEVRCVGIEYHDFPTVEWTVYFKNTGSSDTPILSDIQALDTRFERGPTFEGWAGNPAWRMVRAYDKANSWDGSEFVLHHSMGCYGGFGEYQPLKTLLEPNSRKPLATCLGRPTQGDLPYFNLEWADRGVIVVVGWPGQWSAELIRDAGAGLQVRAGQELTHFKLHPGEEVRTPLIVLQFWSGDPIRSQNLWRRWMLAHNLPRPGGKLPPPQWAGSSAAVYHEMSQATEENQKMFIDRYLEEGLKIDYWWMDAYWFVQPMTNTFYAPDPVRFPRGLRPITDYAHAKGIKSILWFEPENYLAGSWMRLNHPEWTLGINAWQAHDLLDWGNPEALKFIVEHQDNLIVQEGFDTYRLDFNFDPLRWWRQNDPEDRQGITEIGYVSGYLAFYDALLRRHPNLLIDNCASGGRRNDLESMRRSVPLWRSDFAYGPLNTQCQTFGLASWLPFFGTGNKDIDPYIFRCNMTPALVTVFDLRRKDLDYAMLRRLTTQWRQIAPCYLGDYYPLTSYSLAIDVWMAWQFDLPEAGKGMVQAFRRQESPNEVVRFRLRGLNPKADYKVTDLDANQPRQVTGRELMEKGLAINIAQRPGAAVITYEKVN